MEGVQVDRHSRSLKASLGLVSGLSDWDVLDISIAFLEIVLKAPELRRIFLVSERRSSLAGEPL